MKKNNNEAITREVEMTPTSAQMEQFEMMYKSFSRKLFEYLKGKFEKLSKKGAQQIFENFNYIAKSAERAFYEDMMSYSIVDKRISLEPSYKFSVDVSMSKSFNELHQQMIKENQGQKFNDRLEPTDLLTDKNYIVSLYEVLERIDFEDGMHFMYRKDSLFVGYRGLLIISNLAPEKFPGYCYVHALDHEKNLTKDTDMFPLFPSVKMYSDGPRYKLHERGINAGEYVMIVKADRKANK